MQINKKLYTTFVIAILTLSIIAVAIPMASAEITVVPTLSVGTGAPGTVVTVSAGAGGASPFATVTAYWDALAGTVLGHGSASSTGSYSFNVVVPQATYGSHYIVVNDGETESEGAEFIVTPKLTVNSIPPGSPVVDPRALPGDQLTVVGVGFASNDVIDLTLISTTLGTPVSVAITTPVVTSNSTGSFSTTITVPSTIVLAEFDRYNLTAEDEASHVAFDYVVIDYYILCTPNAGPTGITTTISGRIAPSVAFAIRFNGAQIGTGTTAADGSYAVPYTIPSVLSVATYTVDIVWATINTRDTTFEVRDSPTISLGAATGYTGDIVTITGSGFSSSAGITLYFNDIIVNSTSTGFGTTNAGGAIPSGRSFVVPSQPATVYAVRVVDQYGATSSTVYFTILQTPVTSIALRAATYYQGDVLSFDIYTTDRFTTPTTDYCTLTILDPTGLVCWTGNLLTTETTTGTYRLLYQNQMINSNYMMLSSDAPVGTWNWTITYTATVRGAGKATGLFTVAVPPTMQTVLNQLETLRSNITAAITTSQGVIITSLTGLDAKLTTITNNVATIQTTVGTIQTSVSNLNIGSLGSDVTAIKNNVATIQTSIGALEASLEDIGATVTSIEGDVATIQTDLGTLQGTVTSIDDGVATIQTDVGAVQADVTDVLAKSDVDMTPVWIAVVLSLVAAIAAIFAVITIRSKIAG
jgi:prefoldin subunit 5